MSVDVEVKDAICTITINRPEKHNAMDGEHYALLSQAWMRVRDDPEIQVAIITGAGDKTFSAGADLKNLESVFQPQDLWLTQKDQLLNRGLEVWKPVIAAINGRCLAGGMTLMLATDIRVAVETADFAITEVCRGLLAANGGTQRPIKQLPYAIAMELLLTGDPISAQDALRWGLVNAVVSREKLMETALHYARRITKNGPLAVQATKELALRSMDVDMNTGFRLEQMAIRHLLATDDVKEGRAAFAERRQPRFKGQ
ncbi:enoyl-CoA hydratase/isomerase family protein [Variovorax terrae]|uniref:Enoyl-CoA hydratase-related protein n=1 Tax=Variovorax terrae TaxID=2923278 RepID=A0A9X1VUH5_9BURK|nr:enoyl-CoA hydratase-related protein [Variovorax terrae]MCJ0762254.1 enoyl-CoA hydratase-related protein [Variovorax terrae]